jgi:nitrogen regulatory protein PII
MFMVLFVLNNTDHLDDVLEALTGIGVSGVTILESTGSYRHLSKRIPMRYTFGDNTSVPEGNTTIFTIVPDEETVNACLRAIESVTGDLDDPHTGVFSAWPLALTKGIPSQRKE